MPRGFESRPLRCPCPDRTYVKTPARTPGSRVRPPPLWGKPNTAQCRLYRIPCRDKTGSESRADRPLLPVSQPTRDLLTEFESDLRRAPSFDDGAVLRLDGNPGPWHSSPHHFQTQASESLNHRGPVLGRLRFRGLTESGVTGRDDGTGYLCVVPEHAVVAESGHQVTHRSCARRSRQPAHRYGLWGRLPYPRASRTRR